MSVFEPAAIEDYLAWLEPYLAEGGTIKYARDYPFSHRGFLIARRNFTIDGECGSDARSIIVPEGIECVGGPIGHNELYRMDGYQHYGLGGVAIFSDPAFDGLPGVKEARARDRAEQIAFMQELREDLERPVRGDLSAYTASEAPREGGPYRTPSQGLSVYVEDGKVLLLPSTLPHVMTPEGARALAKQLRAAARGAQRRYA